MGRMCRRVDKHLVAHANTHIHAPRTCTHTPHTHKGKHTHTHTKVHTVFHTHTKLHTHTQRYTHTGAHTNIHTQRYTQCYTHTEKSNRLPLMVDSRSDGMYTELPPPPMLLVMWDIDRDARGELNPLPSDSKSSTIRPSGGC